jgi:hypothetical protein
MIRRFLSQPTMKFFRQANTDHPMSRPPLHHGEASDSRSKGDPNNQADNGGNGDGHGDTTSNRNQENNNADGGLSEKGKSLVRERSTD